MYQTSANPIPHPDTESLKKSQMFRELREKLIFYDLRGPTRDGTPQRASDENGEKKSSTRRPARNKRSLRNSNIASNESKLQPHLRKLKNGDKYSQTADKQRFRRGQTSRNPIPHPPSQSSSWDPKENKRTFAFTDDTSKILQRKTLLYSDPFYRPTGVASSREEPIDPRRLISILGDPVPSKKNIIPRRLKVSKGSKKIESSGYVLRKGREKGSSYKRGHLRHPRKIKSMKFKHWDQDERIRHKVS